MLEKIDTGDLARFSAGLLLKECYAKRMLAVCEFILTKVPECPEFYPLISGATYRDGDVESSGIRWLLVSAGNSQLELRAWKIGSAPMLFSLTKNTLESEKELVTQRKADILVSLFLCLSKLLEKVLKEHPSLRVEMTAYMDIGRFFLG